MSCGLKITFLNLRYFSHRLCLTNSSLKKTHRRAAQMTPPAIFHMRIYLMLPLTLICCIFFMVCHDKDHPNTVIDVVYEGEHQYKFSWNANPEPDMSHYFLFGWNGTDTSQTPFKENTAASRYFSYRLKQIPHYSGATVIKDTVTYVANGNWLHFAVAAVNQNGGISKIGTSNFLKSEDLRGNKNSGSETME